MILRETKGLRFDSCHVTRSWSKMQHTGRLHSSDRIDMKQSQSQARDGPVFVVTSRWPPIAFRIFDSTSISLSLRCGSSIAPMSFHIRVNSGKIFSSRSRDDRSGERRAVKFNGMTQEKRVPSSTSAGKITGSSRETPPPFDHLRRERFNFPILASEKRWSEILPPAHSSAAQPFSASELDSPPLRLSNPAEREG